MGDMILNENTDFGEVCADMGNTTGLFTKLSANEQIKMPEQTEQLSGLNTSVRKYLMYQDLMDKKNLITAKCNHSETPALKCDLHCAKSKQTELNWIRLQKYLRFIYRSAISCVPFESVQGVVPDHVAGFLKKIISSLHEEDCQQLFIKLEVLVRDFVIEAKEQLKSLQNNVDEIPVQSLKGLLDSYDAFCAAAENLSPFIPQFDKLLMKRFSINFELLNKNLFRTCFYADAFVQNIIPLYISQLRATNGNTHYANQELIRSYLAFDDEMTDVASKWLDVKKMILTFSKKRVAMNPEQPLLLEYWEVYKEHRELVTSKTWQHRTNKRDMSEFDVQLLSLLDDITSHIICDVETHSTTKKDISNCKTCNSEIMCSCDDCIMKHIFTCGIETPPTSPISLSDSGIITDPLLLEKFNLATKILRNSSDVPHVSKPLSHTKICSESIESKINFENQLKMCKKNQQVNQNKNDGNTCNCTTKIPVSKKFLKLITDKVMSKPTVKSNSDEDSAEVKTKSSSVMPTNVSNITRTSSTPVLSVPTRTIASSDTTISAIQKSQTTINQSTKQSLATKEIKASSAKLKCNHTCSALNKKPSKVASGTQTIKDDCPETVSVKKNKESRRCDCTHCEVFENANGQNGGKNNRTRDRLRIRLNEKRNNALKENNRIEKIENVDNDRETSSNKTKGPDKQNLNTTCLRNSDIKDIRDIKDLLNFIEGTDHNAKLIQSQKKAAKRAKRREKKLMEEKLKEEKLKEEKLKEEKLEQEAQRLLREHRKLVEKKLQENIEQMAKDKKQKSQNTNKSKDDSNKVQQKNNENKKNANNKMVAVKPSPSIEKPLVSNNQNKLNNIGPMVTIKRVVESTNSEPTVTITLKGSTPDKDKLLYTIINGQTSPGKLTEKTPLPKTKLSKKQKRKAKNEMQKNAAELVESNTKELKSKKNGSSKSQIVTNKSLNTNSIVKKSPATQTDDNSNNETKSDFNLQMLRLPPGITITKVNGSTVNRKPNSSAKNESSVTLTKTSPLSSDNRSGVIVVDTVKLNDVLKVLDPPSSVKLPVLGKKTKKKKNKKKSITIQMNEENDIEIQNYPLTYKLSSQILAANSDPSPNGNPIVTIKNPMFYKLQQSLNNKIGKSKVDDIQNNTNTQASIIKGANGMVTIRSPRMSNTNLASCNGHVIEPVHSIGGIISDMKPQVGPNTPVFKSVKTDNNKPFNAQEILSGLPGIEITKINKYTMQNKNECKVLQPADVSIIPTNLANGSNGDVYKLFYDNMDWNLESVFAPKDIKEDEVLDAEELELEAFKRFCQQSVPPKRKEKVAHLNVKDIVLKKKTSCNV